MWRNGVNGEWRRVWCKGGNQGLDALLFLLYGLYGRGWCFMALVGVGLNVIGFW